MTISPAAKETIDRALQLATEETNGVPGAIYAAINRKGEIIYEGAAGVRSLQDPDIKMTTDTIMHIVSFTKLVTTIACLQQVESGKVGLDSPDDIEKHLPEVANAKIVSKEDGKFVFRAPRKRITLRMLLNHTSGYGYTNFNQDLCDLLVEPGKYIELGGEGKFVNSPLIAEPGEEWNYGAGLDLAGILVERLSGMNLSAYFQSYIFEPLGMKEIHFGGERPDLQSRLAGMHCRDSKGTLKPRDHLPIAINTSFYSGGGGLLSTVHDYLTLICCLLNNGTSPNGVQILKSDTVELMFKNSLEENLLPQLDKVFVSALPELSNDCQLQPGCNKAWGLSFLLTLDELPSGRSANSAMWAGLANCFYTIDRAAGIATVVATQILPFFDIKFLELWMKVETDLYKDLKGVN